MAADWTVAAWQGGRSRAQWIGQPLVGKRLWVLRSGAHWCDLPERYGRWKTVHKRFSRWAHAGVWERVFTALTEDRDNRYLMLDSTIVRAHQQAATGKGGPRIRRWGVPEAD